MGNSRSSYAAALKAKPTDWHLEFSMDDQILPLLDSRIIDLSFNKIFLKLVLGEDVFLSNC